MLITEIICLPN